MTIFFSFKKGMIDPSSMYTSITLSLFFQSPFYPLQLSSWLLLDPLKVVNPSLVVFPFSFFIKKFPFKITPSILEKMVVVYFFRKFKLSLERRDTVQFISGVGIRALTEPFTSTKGPGRRHLCHLVYQLSCPR